jgi:hypothetical protein
MKLDLGVDEKLVQKVRGNFYSNYKNLINTT